MGCVRGGGGWTDGRAREQDRKGLEDGGGGGAERGRRPEGGGAAGRRVANDEHGEIQPRCTYVSLEGVRNATRRQAGGAEVARGWIGGLGSSHVRMEGAQNNAHKM